MFRQPEQQFRVRADDAAFPFGYGGSGYTRPICEFLLTFPSASSPFRQNFSENDDVEIARVCVFPFRCAQQRFQRYAQRRGDLAQYGKIRFGHAPLPFGHRLQMHAHLLRKLRLRKPGFPPQRFQSVPECIHIRSSFVSFSYIIAQNTDICNTSRKN